MGKLKCDNCGNTEKFYSSVFLEAKVRVDSNGNTLRTIYDIDKEGVSEYEGIYCCECDNEVNED
ncbi:MAG: hypothetical protein ACLS9F_19420 [Clostridium paraputrificum]